MCALRNASLIPALRKRAMSCFKSPLLHTVFAIAVCHVVGLAQVQNTPPTGISLEIHGQVRFAEGGAPAENVLVRLESYESGGSLMEAFTDRSGKFRFSGLSPAQYEVIVHQSGYVDNSQRVDLQTSTSGYVILQLTRDNSGAPVKAAKGGVDASIPAAAQKEFDKGVEALDAAKIDEAARHFQRAVEIYPRFVEARLKLGAAFMDLGQWDNAERTLKATLEFDPKAANALFALGEIYLRQNKTEDAERMLLQGLQIDSHSYLGHLNLARVYWEKVRTTKDVATARPVLEKSYEQVKLALQINPDLSTAHLLKGNLLLRASRPTDALVEFDEYLRLDPKGQFAEETRAVVDKLRKATAHH
ncbi:MAG: hypothetical protein C5B55_12805 [Blastocatellia bacterium]|nr:MAG: hypothetical protein C5B55_12805 [Blastocatellia bacterium]